MTISEKYKNSNINNEKGTDKKNRIFYNINNNINTNLNQKFLQNSNNNINNNSNFSVYKRKRNYLSLIHSKKRNEISNNSLNMSSTSNINNNCTKENNNNNIKNENKLFEADILSNELLNTKNEEELKKILFPQLILLEQKFINDRKIDQIKESLSILEKDELDLLKCQKVVTRALNKKIYWENEIDNKGKELKEEILKVIGRIKFYQSYGDFFINEIKRLKKA